MYSFKFEFFAPSDGTCDGQLLTKTTTLSPIAITSISHGFAIALTLSPIAITYMDEKEGLAKFVNKRSDSFLHIKRGNDATSMVRKWATGSNKKLMRRTLK